MASSQAQFRSSASAAPISYPGSYLNSACFFIVFHLCLMHGCVPDLNIYNIFSVNWLPGIFTSKVISASQYYPFLSFTILSVLHSKCFFSKLLGLIKFVVVVVKLTDRSSFPSDRSSEGCMAQKISRYLQFTKFRKVEHLKTYTFLTDHY